MDDFASTIRNALPAALVGSLSEITGTTAVVADFPAPLGALVEIETPTGHIVAAEVIGMRDGRTTIAPLGEITGVRHGSKVRLVRTYRDLAVGDNLRGRIVNAHGQCIDGRPRPILTHRTLLRRPAPNATERPLIREPLPTGVRAIDSILRCGLGQRLGVFAGAGVGKSVLLGMLARNSAADVIVIGLVGERGRELNEFIERDLGPQGLARSVIVVATSNEPAIARVQAAHTATSIAEHFRDQGLNVLLIIDSVTRLAFAQREIGLAAGEPPATRGFPPSVFAELPVLVERAGRTARGSITAFYSVLVEGDDPNDPVADTMRGLLDGHLWLSRKLASAGHFPAIDPLQSLSRLMNDITPADEVQAAQLCRELLAAYREKEDLISIGAYRKGTNRTLDVAIDFRESIHQMLRQAQDEAADFEDTRARLKKLGSAIAAKRSAPAVVGSIPMPNASSTPVTT